MRQKNKNCTNISFRQNMSGRRVCYWADPQGFLMICQDIEQKMFSTKRKQLSQLCKELRKSSEIINLKKFVHDQPNKRCKNYFVPCLGLTLAEVAMHDALNETITQNTS